MQLAWVWIFVYFAWTQAPARLLVPIGAFAVISLVFPLALAVIAPFVSGARTYDRLVEHSCWGRWEEVLRLLPSLPEKVPAFERALREGQALAGLGKLHEGLAVFQPFADNGEIPQWMYWSLLALIYRADRNWIQTVAAHERAFELAPENPSILIDLAIALLRFKHDPKRAQDLLERAKTHAIPPIARPFLCSANGLLALARGDAKEAVAQFLDVLKKAHTCLQDNAATRFFLDQTHADLAVAYGRLLDSKRGLRHFHLAGARLRERGWDMLPINVGS